MEKKGGGRWGKVRGYGDTGVGKGIRVEERGGHTLRKEVRCCVLWGREGEYGWGKGGKGYRRWRKEDRDGR